MPIKRVLRRVKTMLRPVQTRRPALSNPSLVVRTHLRAGASKWGSMVDQMLSKQ